MEIEESVLKHMTEAYLKSVHDLIILRRQNEMLKKLANWRECICHVSRDDGYRGINHSTDCETHQLLLQDYRKMMKSEGK